MVVKAIGMMARHSCTARDEGEERNEIGLGLGVLRTEKIGERGLIKLGKGE